MPNNQTVQSGAVTSGPAAERMPLPPVESMKSPLSLVTTEPLVNEMVVNLQRHRLDLINASVTPKTLTFSKHHLARVRRAFHRMILHGEEKLHRLSQLLSDTFFKTCLLNSVVIGEIESTGERFTLSLDLSPDELYTTTDIDLGTRQLEKLRFFDGTSWNQPRLVANTVDYQPTESNGYGIHKIISRIKAEEEIWNKVVDEIFDLDALVNRDKQLRRFSRYVKDVFGIKIVVGELENVREVERALSQLCWSDDHLQQFNIVPDDSTRRFHIVEVKDYLHVNRKQSGWEAVKVVVRWGDKMFEIQVQPLRNFLREREFLTKESHAGFKANRERVRAQIAEKVPLFGFYQALLRWLFLNPDAPAPEYPGVTVHLVE